MFSLVEHWFTDNSGEITHQINYQMGNQQMDGIH